MLTRSYNEVAKARAQRDPQFRRALLREAFSCLLHGELYVAWGMFKIVLFCKRR